MRIADIKGTGRIAAIALAAALLAGACSSDDPPDPVAYFEGLESSQAELDVAFTALFESQAAQELQAFVDDDLGVGDTGTMTDDEEAIVQRFVAEFWAGVAEASQVHRDDLDDLDAPKTVENLHTTYVAAFDDLIKAAPGYLSAAQSTDGAELLETFWEPGSEIEAINEACIALMEEAERQDITIVLPICDDE